MSRALSITLDAELPARARALDADVIAKIFGGCQREGDSCRTNNDCCSQTMNDSGSGRYRLTCIGSTSGTLRACAFVPY